MSGPSYAVGIDLGTTHCALSYVDLDLSEGELLAHHSMAIPQSVDAGSVDARALLPSFLFLPHADQLERGATALPWNPTPMHVVGAFARDLGAKTPGRCVASAKSWLSHAGVDRAGRILPADATEGVEKVSPVEASRAYLAHLREAWDHAHPEAPLADQHVVLTVPASFDPAARELTLDAARAAGLGEPILLEEPQAALYAWIANTLGGDASWREQLAVGDVLLVVDVGGGTVDFSVIAVQESEGELQLERIAVGDHILLGGDNMDLALAYTVKAELEAAGKRIDDWQLRGLTHGCRQAKERLLAGEVEAVPLTVPSRGSKLIGKSLRAELRADQVQRVLLDGFFPEVEVTDEPASAGRGALTALGLPYARDAAVTRHLAAFLTRQREALDGDDTFLRPTAILFNGGVLKAPAIEARLLEVLQGWLTAAGAPAARVLEGADLDGAVARGAAYYAYARENEGVRIRGGLGQAYYVGVESSMPAVPGMPPPVQALCVAPFGLEEGDVAEPPPQELGLVVGEPVSFRFFTSTVRRDDRPGEMLSRWGDDEVVELGRIEATLPAEGRAPGEIVPVRLRARVTELGVFRLEALPREGEHVWKVELDARE